jgi:hypothetical protein
MALAAVSLVNDQVLRIWNEFHAVVLWVVTSYRAVVRYQHFGGSCYIHLQGENLKSVM